MRKQAQIMFYYSFYSAYFTSRNATQPLVMKPEVTIRHHLVEDVFTLLLIRLNPKEKVRVTLALTFANT